MKRILVLGAGFAGLWSAVGAARKLDELKTAIGEVEITVINRDAYHNIRVRNYEADLHDVRLPLDQVLGPIGVKRLEAEVTEIDFARRSVSCSAGRIHQMLPYDRLVMAVGSELARPAIPGLAEFAFNVDTYDAAARLNAHVAAVPSLPSSAGRFTALIVGAGLTGIEAATEMVDKLRASAAAGEGTSAIRPKVILADQAPRIGSNMGESARPVIEQALAALEIETRTGVSVGAIDAEGATLSTGERIPAATVVWCAGMRASPLSKLFPVERDRFGRIPVDHFLRVSGMRDVFAAGDVAWILIDGAHASVMSCQHSRPMGRFAGHNVVCDLMGQPMLPLSIDWYTTILDLGAWGAVYTEGWDRQVVSSGEAAKRTKQLINRVRIYPPPSGERNEILAAGAPGIQSPPQRYP